MLFNSYININEDITLVLAKGGERQYALMRKVLAENKERFERFFPLLYESCGDPVLTRDLKKHYAGADKPDRIQTVYPFLICSKSKKAIIGKFQFIVQPSKKKAYCSYFIDKAFEGQGLMKLILTRMSCEAFESGKIEYIVANINPNNKRSKILLKRCGFETDWFLEKASDTYILEKLTYTDLLRLKKEQEKNNMLFNPFLPQEKALKPLKQIHTGR